MEKLNKLCGIQKREKLFILSLDKNYINDNKEKISNDSGEWQVASTGTMVHYVVEKIEEINITSNPIEYIINDIKDKSYDNFNGTLEQLYNYLLLQSQKIAISTRRGHAENLFMNEFTYKKIDDDIKSKFDITLIEMEDNCLMLCYRGVTDYDAGYVCCYRDSEYIMGSNSPEKYFKYIEYNALKNAE